MGVKDGDHLIVTTEMKLPFDEISEDEPDLIMGNDNMLPMNQIDVDPYDMPQVQGQAIDLIHRSGQLTPPNYSRAHDPLNKLERGPQEGLESNLPPNQ